MVEKQKTPQDWSEYLQKAEGFFNRFPPLPQNAREGIVKVLPWIVLVFGIIGVIGSLGTLGIGSLIVPFTVYRRYFRQPLIFGIGGLASSVLNLLAYAPLKAHRAQGWFYLLYALSISLVLNIISFSLGGILMVLLEVYILFQVRGHYK